MIDHDPSPPGTFGLVQGSSSQNERASGALMATGVTSAPGVEVEQEFLGQDSEGQFRNNKHRY